jgi:hypothetical protein
MEQFKTFEQCCQAQGLDSDTCLPIVSVFPAQHQKAITALAKLIIIAEAVNEGWNPNWNDRSEDKWFPWFDMEVDKNNPSGFRFHAPGCANANSRSAGGSRLCFKTPEICKFVGTNYEDLWRDAMVIPA